MPFSKSKSAKIPHESSSSGRKRSISRDNSHRESAVAKPAKKRTTSAEKGPQRKKRTQWTEEEDGILRSLIPKQMKPRQRIWVGIAEEFNQRSKAVHRTPKDCRERWYDTLDPNLVTSPFSEHEKKLIVDLKRSLGDDKPGGWKWIASHEALKNRSARRIKDQWHSMQRQNQRNAASAAKSLSTPQAIETPSVMKEISPIGSGQFSLYPCHPSNSSGATAGLQKLEGEVVEALLGSFGKTVAEDSSIKENNVPLQQVALSLDRSSPPIERCPILFSDIAFYGV